MAHTLSRRWPKTLFSPARQSSPADAIQPSNVDGKLAFLRENRIFAGISDAERWWLANSTTMVTYDRGSVFHVPDQRGEVIFILKRGRVNLFRIAPDGRKLITAQLHHGTVFGEMAMFGQGMYGCHAEAAADCLICVLSRADLTGLVMRNPVVALNLLEELGARLHTCGSELASLAFGSVSARLAGFLLDEADAFGTVLGMSHQDIGERLGIYRETVSQTLGRFRNDGLVVVETRRIRLLDPKRLSVIAHM